MKLRGIILVALVFAVAVFAASCGSGSGGGGDTGGGGGTTAAAKVAGAKSGDPITVASDIAYRPFEFTEGESRSAST